MVSEKKKRQILKLLFARDRKTVSCSRKAGLRDMQSWVFVVLLAHKHIVQEKCQSLSRVKTSHG